MGVGGDVSPHRLKLPACVIAYVYFKHRSKDTIIEDIVSLLLIHAIYFVYFLIIIRIKSNR